jgi:hypothetical protein
MMREHRPLALLLLATLASIVSLGLATSVRGGTRTIEIGTVGLSSIVANSDTRATITAETSENASIVISVGISSPTVLYAQTNNPSRSAQAQFSGLAPKSSYQYQIVATVGKQRQVKTGTFTTGARATSPVASTQGTAILLNGQPFFPVLSWSQCPNDVGANLNVGINVFMADCRMGTAMSAALAGRAYFAIDADRQGESEPGMIGYFQHDEPENYGFSPEQMPDLSNVLSFQTFTTHFSPSEDPPPSGRGVYARYIAKASVLGFDDYPLASRCPARVGHWRGIDSVYDFQRDLVAIAEGKPTYQWIETNGLENYCGANPVSPQAIKAESWLAVAGGATGIGYFTHGGPNNAWVNFFVSKANQAAILQTTTQFAELGPVLTTTPYYGSAAWGSPLRVGYRIYNGSVYVIAVNSSLAPITARIVVPALKASPGVKTGRSGFTYGEGQRAVRATIGATLTDSFGGYGVHIYIFPAA